MTVTELREIRPQHYEIKFSDGSTVKAGLALVADFSLYTGRELGEEEFSSLTAAASKARTTDRALRIIGARPMSSRELYDRLIEKGERDTDAAEAVAKLIDAHFLDDGEYAAMLVRHYAAKGYGRRKIESELYRRKVAKDLWDEAMEQMPETDDAIDRLLQSRMRGADPSDRTAVKKATDALLRRGYGWEEIRSALYRYESSFEE